MNWVCPSCQVEFEPESHDLARCQWQKEIASMTLKWSEFALLRAAYQVASPSQKQEMYDLAKRADAGNGVQYRKLKTYALELVQQAEKPRSKAAGG